MDKFKIETEEEYRYCIGRGIEPMRSRYFQMDISLRKKLQRQKFGSGNTEQGNLKFYRYAWSISKIRVCEECGKPLWDYSSVHISHILSRGAYAECAYDLRNFNLLCFECHQTWENSLTRKDMRIYNKNLRTIEELKKDYGF